MNPGERKLVHGLAIFEGIALLGALVLFLIIIGNTLVRINENLGGTRDSASAVNASAQNLPDLVDSITASLTAIEHDVQPVKGQLDQINGGLTATSGGLATADGHLSKIQGNLVHIESNLVVAGKDDGLSIVASLISINNEAAAVVSRAVALISSGGAIQGDTSNIAKIAVPINQHLVSISGKAGTVCVLGKLTNPTAPC
ncbi:MAG: hypothetical protein JWM18_2804 [Chloroflexi bacterium]|nr:hypothetical protein [Chloroflexota bacterium]